ncbi:trehalose-phosphatase [Novosphingobium sp. Leaf2]|uniref:trehalose-phosphatase n=1 Tax=Novosphingobium sp. Leaf2 TaxID=1735670 RepID=UPI0006FB2B8C|nr:trehalose-phosphatase [Novosphingobium sp. Leaf2]KQM14698.1 trehalose phosphatase [Novosphingobium sp. Leaf2]
MTQTPSPLAPPLADIVVSTPADLPAPVALGEIERPALFLDFDGTLVSIVDHPDDVAIAQGLPGLLTALSNALDGRLAIVTGRSIAALEGLVGPLQIAVAGSHGGEFRPVAGSAVQPLAKPIAADVVRAVETFARNAGGLLVEPKPFSVAVHYRHHPEARDALLEHAHALAHDNGLGFKHGKNVVELTMPGSDKGAAVNQFMALPAFAGAHPVFLGDDVTDEDAFRAILPFHGCAVLVGAMRATAATHRLPDVAAVHSWLEAGLNAGPAAKENLA